MGWNHIVPEDLRFIQILMKCIPEQHPARKDSGTSGDLTPLRCPKSPLRVKQHREAAGLSQPGIRLCSNPISARLCCFGRTQPQQLPRCRSRPLPHPPPGQPGASLRPLPAVSPLHSTRGCFLPPAGRTVLANKHVTFRKQRSLSRPELKYPCLFHDSVKPQPRRKLCCSCGVSVIPSHPIPSQPSCSASASRRRKPARLKRGELSRGTRCRITTCGTGHKRCFSIKSCAEPAAGMRI